MFSINESMCRECLKAWKRLILKEREKHEAGECTGCVYQGSPSHDYYPCSACTRSGHYGEDWYEAPPEDIAGGLRRAMK